MDLINLFNDYDYELYAGSNCMIESAMIHSSQVKNKAIFFARSGETTNGLSYIKQAVENGAVAVCTQNKTSDIIDGISYINVNDIYDCQAFISSRLFEKPCNKIKVVGVTGTNGKSSFVSIASKLFNALNEKSGNTGTIGTNISGDQLFLAHNTTYEPAIYNEVLFNAKIQNYHYVFSEISSQGIAMQRIKYMSFYSSIFLNLTEEHLDFHKTMQNYFEAKKQLFNQTEGPCIINISDTYGYQLFQQLRKADKEVLTFGYDDQSDYQIISSTCYLDGTFFSLKTKNWERSFFIPLIGEFNIQNTIPAIILAEHEGFLIDDISGKIKTIQGVTGRIELIYQHSPKVYLDYAHTPDALEKVLKVLKKITEGKIILVFGCGGNRDRSKRSVMGKIASVYADLSIITSDNPRNETSATILSDIMMGYDTENYAVVPNRLSAIEYALKAANSNDVVLIAGKGHEEYQIIKNIEYKFSDRQCVNDILNGKKSAD